MDQVYGKSEQMEAPDVSRALRRAVGAVAAAAGVAACVTWATRRVGVSDDRVENLVAYLRDHLTGSEAAVRVVRHLATAAEATTDAALFGRLSNEFEQERAVVRALLTHLGAGERSLKRTAGLATGQILRMAAGGRAGDLSMLRTLEALAVGVQGKRCLWRAMQTLPHGATPVAGRRFVDLESMAVRQWEAIEERRRALAPRTFARAT